MELVLTGVVALLLLNLVVALAAIARRTGADDWLLVVLLAGTTGSALVAVLAVLAGDGGQRFVDVAFVLTGLAAVAASVRAASGRRDADRADGTA